MKIDEQRDILGAKIGPAIDRLEATGVDFRNQIMPTSLEDEAVSNKRVELLALNFVIAIQKEFTRLGLRYADVSAGKTDETFGEDMQKLGAQLGCAGSIFEAFSKLNSWIETSPDAAWYKTLLEVKEDEKTDGNE